MTTPDGTDIFYGAIPVFRGFGSLMDPAMYSPLPDDWTVGVADIVESTKAIANQRYKAVNMAGAAVIAAVTNALDGREFPFVFGGAGGDGGMGPRRFRSGDAGGAGAGQGYPRPGPRYQGRPLRPVPQSVLCDVFRRRTGLGGCRDEAGRVCGTGGSAGHAARSVRPVVPVRGNSLHARAHSVGAGGAGQGRRSASFPQGDRGHHQAGRTVSGCRAAGAAGRATAALAAGRYRV